MKKNNKIAILLNGPREIDMYYKIINSIPEKKREIIISDVVSSETGRNKINEILKKILRKRKIKFRTFSSVYKKIFYKVILSSGELTSTKITFSSIFKYIYSQSFGKLINLMMIGKLFERLFGRPFTGAHRDNLGSFWYPEKNLAETSIKLPKDLDLKLKIYPPRNFNKVFDIFFTISNFEKNIIQKKFRKKKCQIVGYPRYQNLIKRNIYKKKIQKEFGLDKNKKIIFWTPTFIHYPEEQDQNILVWIKNISFFTSYYNIIIRPHPKTLASNPKLKSRLEELNFFVDSNPERDLGNIINVSDLMICDYGGTIFGSLYLYKPILLLNISEELKFIKNLVNSDSLDIKLRELLVNLNTNMAQKEIETKIDYVMSKKYISKVKKIRVKFFDKESKVINKNTKIFILNLLKK